MALFRMKEQNTAVKPLGIPYGMMNFVAIREDNYYYVDKTRFIEKIENSNRYFFFIRPRRFGKSLTMSMLHHYYDINAANKFERLYGVEECTQIASAMCLLTVFFFTRGIREDVVGEVVILVDE